MTVLNYTTAVPALKTAHELQVLLAEAGARRVMTSYDNGSPTGVTFELDTAHGPKVFELPVDVEAMRGAMLKAWRAGKARSISETKARDLKHAERVAWRVLKDWLTAQLTLIAAAQATPDQVFLPYLKTPDGRTLYAAYVARENLLELEGRPS